MKNRYTVIDGTVYIHTKQGIDILVDEADLPTVSKYSTWSVNTLRTGTGYAQTQIKQPDGKRKTIMMHRILLDQVSDGLQIDHINRVGTDNRRDNIRITTPRINKLNTGPYRNNKTGFKNVSLRKTIRPTSKRYWGSVNVKGKTVFYGLFKRAEDAAFACDLARLKYQGVDAILPDSLNFPEAYDLYVCLLSLSEN